MTGFSAFKTTERSVVLSLSAAFQIDRTSARLTLEKDAEENSILDHVANCSWTDQSLHERIHDCLHSS